MKTSNLEVRTQHSDAEIARLRLLMAKVDEELVRAPVSEGLKGSWAEMVKLLAVGPAPDVRTCPVCSNIVMREATLCGHCWSKLDSLPAG